MLRFTVSPRLFPCALTLAALATFSCSALHAQTNTEVALLEPASPPAVAAEPAAPRVAPKVSIEGHIADPQGLAVPGASLELLRGGFVAARVETDAQGNFRLFAAPGSYRIRISSPGMARLEEPLQLAAGAQARFDRSLSLAQASDSVTVSASGYQIGEQSAATRVPIRPLDLPQTVTTVAQDMLRDRAVESMQEALAYIPGVSQILGEGRRDQISIRGMNANSDQYIDGVKDDATYYRDLSNTDHIEVVEGPAAVLYGRGTSGGLVDRITKKPRNEGTLAEFATTQGGYGSKRVEGDVDTLLGSPKLGLRTTGAWEQGGSFRHYYSLGRYAFAPTLRWRPSPNQNVTLQAERLRDERVPDRGIPSVNGRPAPVPLGTYYGYALTGGTAPADYLHNAVTDETLDWHGKLGGWQAHEVFRHAGYQTAFQNTYPSAVSNGKVTRGEYNGTSLQENFFNQSEAWRRFRTFAVEHTFLAGIEYGHQSIRRTQFTGTAASVDLFNPTQIAPTLSTSINTNNRFIGQTVAAYAQDEMAFAKYWKLLAGVRFDNYRQSQHDFKTPANSRARADNAPSPRIGLLFQPSPESTYYVSWSHTFDPSGESLSLTAGSTNNTAQLKPEKTDNYETGAKHLFFEDRLTANAALFRLNRTDVKVPDYTADPTGTTYINAGTQRTDGFELSASGSLTQHWKMNGGWAWMDAYYVDNPTLSNGVQLQGKRAQLIPANSGSLWQVYEWTRGFGVGLGAVATSSRSAATDNLVRLPGYARLDASAYYRTRHWDLDAHVENLSDVHYYLSAQSDQQIMPGTPVLARVGLRVKF
jgi:catecholate siderophore receptor